MPVVLISYSRSGGSLISGVLASLPAVELASEVSPRWNEVHHVAAQAKQWYGHELTAKDFTGQVLEWEKRCVENKKTLVIRDFSFISFTPHRSNNFSPAATFETTGALEGKTPLRVFAFVRNAIDVWISRECPPRFSEGYVKFAEALKTQGIKIFTYENFCRNPQQELEKICNYLQLEFDVSALEKGMNYPHLTGDFPSGNFSRGRKAGKITELKRKKIPRFLQKKLQNDKLLHKANQLLGYDTAYEDQFIPAETFPSSFALECKWMLKRLLGKYPGDVY